MFHEHAFFRLVDETVEDLKRQFTPGELLMILDVQNGCLLTPGLLGQHVGANVHDSFALYPGQFEEKWEVDKDVLLTKLSQCNTWQRGVLEGWAGRFWQLVALPNGANLDPRGYVGKGKFSLTGALGAMARELDEAVTLLEKTKHAFKSRLTGEAREAVERAQTALAGL